MNTILTGRNKTGNEIRAEGAHALSEAMKTNTALTQLGFEHKNEKHRRLQILFYVQRIPSC